MLLFAFGIWELLTQFALFNAAQSALKSTFLASAIRKCGGNEEKGNVVYTAYGSNGQVSFLVHPILCGINTSLPHLQKNMVELLI